MKIGHAAALAVVGWYLMTPPAYKQGVNPSAPLYEWENRQAFDTADACEKGRDALVLCGEVLNGAKQGSVIDACGFLGQPRPLKDKNQDAIVGQIALQNMEARCVATDDPRLKETSK